MCSIPATLTQKSLKTLLHFILQDEIKYGKECKTQDENGVTVGKVNFKNNSSEFLRKEMLILYILSDILFSSLY